MTDQHYFQGLHETALDFTMKAFYADRLAAYSETPQPFSSGDSGDTTQERH